MKVPFVDLTWQHRQIAAELMPRLVEVMESGAFVSSPTLAAFESNFAAYIGVGHCVGVGSGTDALLLALRALELPSGSEVITIPTTFFATASAIVHAGLVPVFVDIDPKTRNIDMHLVRKALTPRTRVIIPVHLYGEPVDMGPLLALAQEHSLLILEDASQAHGALYKGRRAGSFGIAAGFSFYPSKNLGAYGQAGAVLTDDAMLAQRIRVYRNQGCAVKYDHEVMGYNSRLDPVQAVVLDQELRHLDEWNILRRNIASRYRALLVDMPQVELPPEQAVGQGAYHLFAVRIPARDRDSCVEYLEHAGVSAGIHYPIPVHLNRAFGPFGHRPGDFPCAESLAKEIMSLPIYPGMSDEQVCFVAETLRDYFHA